MILAISAAARVDIGLAATFIGIGIVVTGLIVYIMIQVRGERLQNIEYRSQGRPPTT